MSNPFQHSLSPLKHHQNPGVSTGQESLNELTFRFGRDATTGGSKTSLAGAVSLDFAESQASATFPDMSSSETTSSFSRSNGAFDSYQTISSDDSSTEVIFELRKSNNQLSVTTTFVHKLFNMVADKVYQHLISWNTGGTSFIVYNANEFSREVLPKHFKHSNFSSFVRQLNMYGFHKINKSMRNQKVNDAGQIWEFSHAKFLRDRADLLDEIRRKESVMMDSSRALSSQQSAESQNQLVALQIAQVETNTQLRKIQESLGVFMQEMAEIKKTQAIQHEMLTNFYNHLQGASGVTFDMYQSQVMFRLGQPQQPQTQIQSALPQNSNPTMTLAHAASAVSLEQLQASALQVQSMQRIIDDQNLIASQATLMLQPQAQLSHQFQPRLSGDWSQQLSQSAPPPSPISPYKQ